MAEDDGSSFPVVFFDGEREINMGGVTITPSIQFKSLQLGLSQRIGISPNQITVYLVKKPRSSPEFCRKTIITGKVNLSAIARERDCFFLVALKRSRRNRKLKTKPGGPDFDYYFPVNNLALPQGNFVLLRRNAQVPGYMWPQYEQIVRPEFIDHDKNWRNLQIQRQNYEMMMMKSNTDFNNFSNVTLDLDSSRPTLEASLGICEECANANSEGVQVPFHRCIHDIVTVGFRSTAGPIARPRGDR